MKKDFLHAVEKHNRVVLVGGVSGVGMGGYISAGGHSRLSPQLGFAVDNVLEIKVVLADGRVATCTQSKTVIEDNGSVETRNDGDLFWALRGGGGGTFGVVVYYVLKLHPAPNTFVSAVIRGSLYKNASDAHILEQGKKAYDEWVRTAPSHWGGSFGFRSGSIASWLFKFGPWEGETESELRPFLEFQARYHQQFNFFLTNVTSAAGYGVLHGSSIGKHSRSIVAGALISPDKHNTTSLRDLIVQEVMDDIFGISNCWFQRLGGKISEYGATSSSVHPGFRRAMSRVG